MTVPIFKALYQFLGINFEKPEYATAFDNRFRVLTVYFHRHSTVYNSTAYKALALRFDLWARAPVEVLKLYFQHFQYLLTVSRFKRFNILHCLKRATLVRRILHALKANTFDSTINEEILGKDTDWHCGEKSAMLMPRMTSQKLCAWFYRITGLYRMRELTSTWLEIDTDRNLRL
jgi:hypothetical protein